MGCDWLFGTDMHEINILPRTGEYDDDCFDKAEAVEVDGNVFVRKRTSHLVLTSYDDYRGTQRDYLGCSQCEEFISTTDSYGEHDGPFYCSNCGCEIDHSFIVDYVSGDVIWQSGDGYLGDLADWGNWRNERILTDGKDR